MTESSFPERVRALGLPLDKIIVIASGVLDTLGIRKADDIDIAAAPELFETFENDSAWERHDAPWGDVYYTNGDAEVWPGWGMPNSGDALYEELLPDTVEIDGIRYMSLDYIRAWKRKKGREKDMHDIALIDKYLETHHD